MERTAYLDRARTRGVNPLVYWLARAVLQPFFHVWFRMTRLGREHIPAEGPVIFAANHRSFLDPFVIGTMARRPLYYVAKKELFTHRLSAWFLNSLGAFPIDRGASDQDAMATAKAILDRGDAVLIFPEGTRLRPGPLGEPKRGVGRLALETGAPVVPIAVTGTEDVRRGWRIRPRKVRIRAGRPLHFPQVDQPSRELATAVTERIWPCVALQWEWLGGMAPLRRAALVPAGDGAGGAVERALLAGGVKVHHAADAPGDELAVFPTPYGFIAERPGARAVACTEDGALVPDRLEDAGRIVVASEDRAFARQLAGVLGRAGAQVRVARPDEERPQLTAARAA